MKIRIVKDDRGVGYVAPGVGDYVGTLVAVAYTLAGEDIGLLRGVRNRLALDGHGQLADRMTALLHSMEVDA